MTIHQLASKKPYGTLDGAKEAAFRAIESGDLVEYLIKKNIRFTDSQQKKYKGNKAVRIELGLTTLGNFFSRF